MASANPDSRSSPRLLASSQWHLLGFGAALLGNLAAIPIVIRWIGIDAFGTAGIVVAICAPLTLIGGSVAQALVREMSCRMQAMDTVGAWRHAHAALRLVGFVSVVLAGGIIALGPWVAELFMPNSDDTTRLTRLFLPTSLGWLAQQVIAVLQAIVVSQQDFRRVAALNAVTALTTLAATLVVTANAPTAVGYLWSLAAGFWITAACWVIALRRDLARAPGPGLGVEFRALLHFTRWQVVTQLAGTLSNQIDRYMLGATTTSSEVGSYNVAKRLQESASIGVLKVGEVLLPRFGALSDAPIGAHAPLYLRATWALTMFSAAVLAPIAGLAHEALAVWISPTGAPDADSMLVLLCLAALVGSGSTVHFAHDLGRGRQRLVAVVSVVHSVLTLLLTVTLIVTFGPSAAGGGLLGANLFRLMATLWLARQTLGTSAPWPILLCSNGIPIAAGTALALIVHGVKPTWVTNWPTLLTAGAAISVATVITGTLLTWTIPAGRPLVRDAMNAILPQYWHFRR